MSAEKELEKIAYNNMKFTRDQRTEAIKQLADYIPSAEAVRILSAIAHNDMKFLREQCNLAIRALGGIKKPSKIHISVE